MASIIEQNLPADLLQALGAYIQTCAHIELQTAVLILEIEKRYRIKAFTSDVSFPEFRKLTAGKLIGELKRTLKDNQPDPKIRFDELVSRLENGKNNRHIAVHGAFYFDEAKQNFRVNFFNWVGEKLVEEPANITANLLASGLTEADSIYREILDLSEIIKSGATNNENA